jgi:hypothetical protein
MEWQLGLFLHEAALEPDEMPSPRQGSAASLRRGCKDKVCRAPKPCDWIPAFPLMKVSLQKVKLCSHNVSLSFMPCSYVYFKS